VVGLLVVPLVPGLLVVPVVGFLAGVFLPPVVRGLAVPVGVGVAVPVGVGVVVVAGICAWTNDGNVATGAATAIPKTREAAMVLRSLLILTNHSS
jgi:hypothetical protein